MFRVIIAAMQGKLQDLLPCLRNFWQQGAGSWVHRQITAVEILHGGAAALRTG